jgi:hypothetical protein
MASAPKRLVRSDEIIGITSMITVSQENCQGLYKQFPQLPMRAQSSFPLSCFVWSKFVILDSVEEADRINETLLVHAAKIFHVPSLTVKAEPVPAFAITGTLCAFGFVFGPAAYEKYLEYLQTFTLKRLADYKQNPVEETFETYTRQPEEPYLHGLKEVCIPEGLRKVLQPMVIAMTKKYFG